MLPDVFFYRWQEEAAHGAAGFSGRLVDPCLFVVYTFLMGNSRENDLNEKQIFSALAQNREALKKCRVMKLGLFGSFARGDQTPRSDIDFMVELQSPSFDNFMNLVFCLEGIFGRKVDLVTKGNLSPHIRPFVEKEVKWYEAK
ncbi:MAG: nucleotidyltransferase family protein [Candidatus Margulisiibacteriota bacterium]